MAKEKLFRLKLKLQEVIEEDSAVFPLFSNSQMVSGIDQIKSVLDTFNEQLHKFIDSTLIPNKKVKKV